MSFFVMTAGRSLNTPGSHLYVFDVPSAREAHQSAKDEYRKKQGLATNIHVESLVLHEAGSLEEAATFLEGIVAQMQIADLDKQRTE